LKIVQTEDFFHPEAGYQINILSKYLSKFGHDVTVITSKTEKIPDWLTTFFNIENIEEKDEVYTKNTGVKIIRLPIKKFVSGRAIFTKSLKKCINELNPDILYIHGNDTLSAMTFIKKTGRLNYPVITDSHMLEMASVNRLNKLFRLYYRKFITPKIIKNNLTVIRTQDDDYVNRCLGIPLSQAPWVSYGSDTLIFHPDEQIKNDFRRENSISTDDFVIIYAGKLDSSKGGLFLAETFLKKFNINKNVVLIVVGNTVGDYGESVENTFIKSENRIIRFPTQKYNDLAKFYQSSDLCVFAKQCSLSFYDAQACGLPVLSEDNNINTDRCSHKNGWNFRSDNTEDFRDKIEMILNINPEEYKNYSNNAYKYITESYDYEIKSREYERILQNACDRFNDLKHKR